MKDKKHKKRLSHIKCTAFVDCGTHVLTNSDWYTHLTYQNRKSNAKPISPLVVHGPLQINKRVINLNLSVIWNVPAAWWAEVQNVYFFIFVSLPHSDKNVCCMLVKNIVILTGLTGHIFICFYKCHTSYLIVSTVKKCSLTICSLNLEVKVWQVSMTLWATKMHLLNQSCHFSLSFNCVLLPLVFIIALNCIEWNV